MDKTLTIDVDEQLKVTVYLDNTTEELVAEFVFDGNLRFDLTFAELNKLYETIREINSRGILNP